MKASIHPPQPEKEKPGQENWQASAALNFDQNTQPPKTRGEKIFNGLSWALFGWLANAAVSVKLADTLENFFRPIYKTYGQKMANSRVFTAFFNKPEQKEEASVLAHSLFSVIALLPGGYSVLLPIKLMEDQKVKLVKTFDRWFGPGTPDENTKQLVEARHSYLEAAPKLNWGDMIKGRTVPVVGIVATHFAFASDKTNIVNLAVGHEAFPGLNKGINWVGSKLYSGTKHSRYESVRTLTQKAEDHLDRGVKKHIAMYGEEHFRDKDTKKLRTGEDRLRGYMSNISIDLVYSALVAAETYILGHLSAFKREVRNEAKHARAEGAPISEKRKFHLDQPAGITEPHSSDTPTNQLEKTQYKARIAPTEAVSRVQSA